MKNKSIVFLIIITTLTFNNCSKDESQSEKIITDISVTSSQSLINWIDANDLAQKLNNTLNYSSGSALESEILKQQTYNTDTTQANATIAFKTAFVSKYNDSNTTNNTVTVSLLKNIQETQSVELKADGPGNTYDLITSILAPGFNPLETPDCSHTQFGDHIDELFDTDLNTNVFRFFIHNSPDNDRCINFDRQRNEIKTYDNSPDNLLGIENETVTYKWKFKLKSGFQSSPNFTHIHQLKSVGGDLASMPMYTLTTRKGNPDKLELRYAETDNQITLTQIDLAPFIGSWVDVTETIKYGTSGTYNIKIKKISDETVLLNYSNASIVNWRPAATFVRPKWGIYRSLINVQDLRDEEVLFADFSITEIDN